MSLLRFCSWFIPSSFKATSLSSDRLQSATKYGYPSSCGSDLVALGGQIPEDLASRMSLVTGRQPFPFKTPIFPSAIHRLTVHVFFESNQCAIQELDLGVDVIYSPANQPPCNSEPTSLSAAFSFEAPRKTVDDRAYNPPSTPTRPHKQLNNDSPIHSDNSDQTVGNGFDFFESNGYFGDNTESIATDADSDLAACSLPSNAIPFAICGACTQGDSGSYKDDDKISRLRDDMPLSGKKIVHNGVTYTIQLRLGEGATARVMLARTDENVDVAVKVFSKKVLAGRRKLKEIDVESSTAALDGIGLKTEFEIHRRVTECGSSLLLPLLRAFEDNQNIYFIMPLYQFSLRDVINMRIEEGVLFSEIQSRTWAAELILGLIHLYTICRTLHLDIKPENILMSRENHLVWADFGLSEFRAPPNRAQKIDLEVKKWLIYKVRGTEEYSAPEVGLWDPTKSRRDVQAFGINGMKVDVFSLGCVIFELATLTGFLEGVRDGDDFQRRFYLIGQIPDLRMRDLLQRMICYQPYKRIDIFRVQKHAFFDGIDWDDIATGHKDVFSDAAIPYHVEDPSASVAFSTFDIELALNEDIAVTDKDLKELCDTIGPINYVCPAEVAAPFHLQ